MKIIEQVFDKLHSSKTITDIERIIPELGLEKFQMSNENYPKIEFRITKDEIEKLKDKGILTKENSLGNISNLDPLTYLLYSVLWKNGDLRKLKHIIEGIISGQQDEKDDGLVFYQFGKYLTKKDDEPIIDQHVLRAFGIFKANGDNDKIERLCQLSVITKKEKELIEQYKFWLRSDLTVELRNEDQYSYYVDKVLFAVGKSVKMKGTAGNTVLKK